MKKPKVGSVWLFGNGAREYTVTDVDDDEVVLTTFDKKLYVEYLKIFHQYYKMKHVPSSKIWNSLNS